MTDDTHDMDLRAVFVDGVAQRLAVDGERLVIAAVLLVPALQRAVELRRVDTHQDGADGGLARRLADTVAAPDLEAGKRFLAKIIDSIPKSPCSRVRRTASRRSRGRGCCAGNGAAPCGCAGHRYL